MKVIYLLALLAIDLSETVNILEPSSSIPFIDDIPLWLRIEFEPGSAACFSVFLDGKYEMATCEENSIIESKVMPGNHSLQLYPTHLLKSQGDVVRHEFQVLEPTDRLPQHLSDDGMRLSLPACVDEYHKFWYNSGVWYRPKRNPNDCLNSFWNWS